MTPVMKPKLPSLEKLSPYLKSIDTTRRYSNFGPLAVLLEDRLAKRYGLEHGAVATVANATLGLALALAIQEPPAGSLCVIPAWTFVATAHAAMMVGMVPYFVDVAAAGWALEPQRALDELRTAPGPVGAIMPVAPFGAPFDVTAWETFHRETGLPVVIDAAASFDTLRPSSIPTVVSLHATKVLGVGEGGFVISTDPTVARSVRERSNFGFAGTRFARTAAFNAKLSEYHAAVGNAALDEWSSIRPEWMAVARRYRAAFGADDRVSLQSGFGETWIGSTCLLEFSGFQSKQVERALASVDIETRRWWEDGAHRHPATSSFPRANVPATEALCRSTLAVPLYRGLDETEIDRIGRTVLAALETDGAVTSP